MTQNQDNSNKDPTCLVCKRVRPKEIAYYAHLIFNETDKQTIHQIIQDTCNAINYADHTNRIPLCGISKRSILVGLFYLYGIQHKIWITQLELQKILKVDTPTIAKSYRKWLNKYPELFQPNLQNYINEKHYHHLENYRKKNCQLSEGNT
jgi:hypothetical protein